MKRARLIILLLLLLLAIFSSWLFATESGLRWVYQRAESSLPNELKIKQLSGKLIGPIELEAMEYEQDGTQIKTGQIIFDWQPSSLFLAKLEINRFYIQSLDIVLAETDKTPQTQQPDQDFSLPEIHLPLRIALHQAEINNLNLRQGEQNFALQQIRLNTRTQISTIEIEELSVLADNFSLTIKGELKPNSHYRHDLSIDWQATLPSSGVIKGQGQLLGDISSTQLTQQVSGPLQLNLNAKLNDLLGQLNWQAKMEVPEFDSTKLDASLPALNGKLSLDAKGDLSTAAVSGTLQANAAEIGPLNASFELQRRADSTIEITQLILLAPRTQTELKLSGQLLPNDQLGTVNLDLSWKNLRWPMQDPAFFNSASGSGKIEGTMEQYQITFTSDSPWQERVPSTWQARATGNLQGLDIQSLRVRALNGEVMATGQLRWSPALSWKADITASNIDPAALWPAWPGQLQAKLSTQGSTKNDELQATVDISQLDGTLRRFPVSLRSQLALHGEKINIQQFDFHSGKSQITLQGELAKTLALNWSIASDNLAELYPQARGQLHTKGFVTGTADVPVVAASINGKAIKLMDYEIGSIAGELAIDLFKWQQIKIDLTAESLDLNSYALQTLNINADAQQLQIKTVSRQATTEIVVNGEAYANGWRGQIERADMLSAEYDNWQLVNPVTLDINDRSFVADKLCWRSNKDGSLCIKLEQENTRYHASVAASKLPLPLLSSWLPPDLQLDGVSDATAEIDYQAPDKLFGEIAIVLPAGAVSYPLLEGERELWQYRNGRLDISLNAKEIKLSSDFAMSNGDQFHGAVTLPGAKLLALDSQTQTLQASAELSVRDLGLIEALLPDVQDLKGDIGLNLTLTGTLAQPRLEGHAELNNSSLRIPRLGLNISQLSVQAQSAGFEKIVFSLSANSGDGKLSINGQTLVDNRAGWPTELSIKGDDFEVSHIAEARVNVSPDLNVKLQQRKVEISGKVHIPYAKLQPKDITTAAQVSEDAVIIGGEQVVEEKWEVHTRVRLTLGERVNFNGFGFEGRFGGSLLIEDEPGQLTRATGEITIPEGRYRAYGQRLEVEYGRIIFTGGPVTNPGLDLRAVRRVNSITAGLKIRGSFKQPVLEVFSIPNMGETDALAYLLLGRPIENTSNEEGAMMAKATLALGLSGGDSLARELGDRFGFDEMRVESSESYDQASLVVGRYLSPKLYISYGVGLIEAINTLTVRYQISEKWQLKAESGEAQGADIFYIFER